MGGMMGGMMGSMPMMPPRSHQPGLGGRHVGTSFKAPMKGFGGGRTKANPFHYLPAGTNTMGYVRGGEIVGGNYAGGGHIPGKGNTDTVPAMLTPGEFVIKKSAAQAHKKLVKAINDSDGGPVRGYAKGGTVTIGPEHKGQKSVHFKKGALHRQLGVPEGEKIPASKMAAARSGKLGPLAKKRAVFAQGMLKKGRETANH